MLRWSLRLGSILGVPLYVHWTFLLLMGWLLAGPLLSPGTPRAQALAQGLRAVGFVLSIFGCVVLHEMGHALAARRFGIGTRDITLLPIGGVARLERIPEKPWQELVVAIAGPIVNVVIAAIVIPLALAMHGWNAFTGAADGATMDYRVNFLASLGSVNVVLALFNLVPAFPMDGGRILRAVLAMIMLDRVKATRGAAVVGQVVAVIFAMWGLFSGNVLLMLVALFVFMAGGAEAQAEEFRAALRGLPVKAAMMRRFVSLRASDTLARAAEELLAGSQQDFLVLADDARGDDDAAALVGVLTRSDLARGLAAGKPDALVSSVMRPACAPVSEDDDLQSALSGSRMIQTRQRRAGFAPNASAPVKAMAPSSRGVTAGAARQHEIAPDEESDVAMLSESCPILAVVRRNHVPPGDERIVGMVTPENVAELVMIRTASAGAG